MQLQYFPAGGLGAVRPTVGNAAAATLYGIDVDFTARPTRELTLNGGFEILHAQFDRYDNAVLNAPATDGFGGLQQAVDRKKHTSELQSLMRISYDVFCL